MDEYQVGWLTKWVDQMTSDGELPEKFFLSGHSYGGYLSSLFACKHPERVKALFLNSPIGHEPLPADYDPMTVRLSSTQLDAVSYPEATLGKFLWERNLTPIDMGRILPQFAYDKVVR